MRRVALALAAGVALTHVPLAAQVDPSGAWRTWTTPHFRIHARAELADAARHLARESERAWALLARELVPPSGRIDVTLTDNVDFANGFATVFPSNRITLFLSSPAGGLSLVHFDDWLRLVMTHELVHIFHIDRARGVWRVFRSVLGRAPFLFPNAWQPSWVVEGLATYYESRLTAAGRVRGGFHGQLLAARAGGAWPDPGDAGLGSPAWPAGLAPYAWGSRFFTHQTQLHGDSVVPRFIEATAGQLWPLRISAALSGAGGDDLDRGWRRLRHAWAGRGGPRGRVVVRGLRNEARPRVADDGRMAWVEHTGRDVPHIVVRDSAGTVVARRVVNGDADLAWLGDTLYATQLEFGSPVQIWSDLYRWRPDGAWERLTRGARVTTPFAAGDGRVGVVMTLPGTHAVAAWHPGRAAVERVASPPGNDWGRVAVSPDARLVAAARHAEGRWDIVVWPAGDPARVRHVTADQALDGDPAWTPDGTRLLFTSERFGIPQIFAWRVADGRLSRLTEEPTGARQPAMDDAGRLWYVTVLADGFAVLVDPAPQPLFGAAVAAPASRIAPAGEVPVRETGYRPWAALRPHYWLPVVSDQGLPGVFVGLATSGADPVGRVSWGTLLMVAPGSGRAAGFLSARYSRWKAWTVDAGVSADWDFAGNVQDSAGARFAVLGRERFATAGVTWRHRRWRRTGFIRVGVEWEDDGFVAHDPAAPDVTRFDLTRWGPVVSTGWSHARRPPLAISPENGVAVTALYRRRWEAGGPDWANEWRAGASGYVALPFPGFANWVVAVNGRVGLKTGPLGGTFELGGESGGSFELVPGVSLGERRSFPLRAYPPNPARFDRVATAAVELRIPVALVAQALWELPLMVDRISLSVFAETGDGWDGGETADLLRFPGAGAEAVWDLALGGDIPLRVRTGLAVPLRTGLTRSAGEPRGYVAFGSAF